MLFFSNTKRWWMVRELDGNENEGRSSVRLQWAGKYWKVRWLEPPGYLIYHEAVEIESQTKSFFILFSYFSNNLQSSTVLLTSRSGPDQTDFEGIWLYEYDVNIEEEDYWNFVHIRNIWRQHMIHICNSSYSNNDNMEENIGVYAYIVNAVKAKSGLLRPNISN